MKQKPFLSAVLIVKNELENIQFALKSLEGFADQLIILDTGSEDGTLNFCQEQAKKNEKIEIFTTLWQDDFSLARNQAINYAEGEWLLIVDADEVLVFSENFRQEIEILDKEKVYFLEIINYPERLNASILGRQIGLRLIPNTGKFFFTGKIHEKPERTDGKSLIAEKITFLQISHYGYRDQKLKAKRNLLIIEKALEKNMPLSEKIRMISLAITEYLVLEKFEQALTYLKNLENIFSQLTPVEIYREPLIHLAYKYFLMVCFNKEPALFILYVFKALNYFPDSLVFLEYLAHHYFRAGDLEKSREVWERMAIMLKNKNYYPFFQFSEEDLWQKINQAQELIKKVISN